MDQVLVYLEPGYKPALATGYLPSQGTGGPRVGRWSSESLWSAGRCVKHEVVLQGRGGFLVLNLVVLAYRKQPNVVVAWQLH